MLGIQTMQYHVYLGTCQWLVMPTQWAKESTTSTLSKHANAVWTWAAIIASLLSDKKCKKCLIWDMFLLYAWTVDSTSCYNSMTLHQSKHIQLRQHMQDVKIFMTIQWVKRMWSSCITKMPGAYNILKSNIRQQSYRVVMSGMTQFHVKRWTKSIPNNNTLLNVAEVSKDVTLFVVVAT